MKNKITNICGFIVMFLTSAFATSEAHLIELPQPVKIIMMILMATSVATIGWYTGKPTEKR